MMIKVGDIVKSMDFPHTDKCYMIGKVVKTDLEIIQCETIKQVSLGKEVEINGFNNTFSTVKPGYHWMECKFMTPRITVLG